MNNKQKAVTVSDKIILSERDTLLLLNVLKNPPPPTVRMIRAAQACFFLSNKKLAGKDI